MIRSLSHALVALSVLVVAGCSRSPASSPPPAQPELSAQKAELLANGDFESESIGSVPASWTVLNYANATGAAGTERVPPANFASLQLTGLGTKTSQTFVVGGTNRSQRDPDLPLDASFRYPRYGTRSVRLNYLGAASKGAGQNTNVFRQTMTTGLYDVDPTDGQVHVRFAVAAVMENPAHGYNEQPYYFVELVNLTRGTTVYSDFAVAGALGMPWNTTLGAVSGNTTSWLDWGLVDIAPGNTNLLPGDQVLLTVVAAGCKDGAHFSRVYVDGFGSQPPGIYTWATANAPQVLASGTITYTLHYANAGATNAIGTRVDMVIPPNSTFASTTGSNCTQPAVGGTGTLSCPVGLLAP
ncbi:MAG: hypothetical protein RL653_401, partial [Pseudomonadota bacterium]